MGNYYINDKAYSQKELIDQSRLIVNGDCEDWEKEIWKTIASWFSSDPNISFQTSGTTGSPKTIIHSKEAIKASSEITQKFFNLPIGSKVLLCLPAFYIAGKMMVYRALHCGWKLTYAKPASSVTFPSNETFDFTALVPMQLQNILQVDKGCLSRIKHVLIGGTTVSPRLINQLSGLPTQFYESYGSTETLSHVAIKRLGTDKEFYAVEGVTFGIDDRNCLSISAPHIGSTPIQTNDIVNLSSYNSFEFVGRYDDVINTGGVKINPFEVENKITGLIPNNYYIGKKDDELLGEKVVLYVEQDPSLAIDIDQIFEKLAANLNKFERPKEIVLKDNFERTFSGKIKRNK